MRACQSISTLIIKVWTLKNSRVLAHHILSLSLIANKLWGIHIGMMMILTLLIHWPMSFMSLIYVICFIRVIFVILMMHRINIKRLICKIFHYVVEVMVIHMSKGFALLNWELLIHIENLKFTKFRFSHAWCCERILQCWYQLFAF